MRGDNSSFEGNQKTGTATERNERRSCQFERENSGQRLGTQDHRVGWMVIQGSEAASRCAESRLRNLQGQKWVKSKQWGGLIMGSVLDGDSRKSKEEEMDGRYCGSRREDPDFESIQSGIGEARFSQKNNCE